MHIEKYSIPAEQLVKGAWYVGRGRNGNVGLWDGEMFLVIGYKFDRPTIKYESPYKDEEGTFQAFLRIDEGTMIEPFGDIGWDAHYGRLMRFSCCDQE
ncbi:hypothetical protein HFV02_13495 [Acidithiobacillus caldus]|uniref:hypothetical protein n=1 Tax=Acidithiobacillus caldus TaxID=33059 RepID=UPI001C078E56|nr:hypothetical protein [Acidithiobacillus caldus]MBU2803239.1 hypothetical protein [Acidithiobacillus caldus]